MLESDTNTRYWSSMRVQWYTFWIFSTPPVGFSHPQLSSLTRVCANHILHSPAARVTRLTEEQRLLPVSLTLCCRLGEPLVKGMVFMERWDERRQNAWSCLPTTFGLDITNWGTLLKK